MKSSANSPKQNKKSSLTDAGSKSFNASGSPFQFKDNRQETTALLQLQTMADTKEPLVQLKSRVKDLQRAGDLQQTSQDLNTQMYNPLQRMKAVSSNPSFSASVAQRTVWEWNDKYWMPIRTEGMPTERPTKVGKYMGERVSTGSEDVYGKEQTDTEINSSSESEERARTVKVPKSEYIGGAANDSHIHQYGGGFHLKLGKSRFNLVQNGIVYNDKYQEAIVALKNITGDRAVWAQEMIGYIEQMVSDYQ
jgi:hypothetical protein